MIDQSVQRLQRAQELVTAGRRDEALEVLDELTRLWQPDQTVTTREAADFLGIRSINTLKALLKAKGIRTVMNGNRIMVPMDALLALKKSREVARLRASDTAHDTGFDDDRPMSQAEMDALHDTRPGTLPWQRK
jgi:hypothetical protein